MKFSSSFNKKISALLIISVLAVNFSFLSFPNEARAETDWKQVLKVAGGLAGVIAVTTGALCLANLGLNCGSVTAQVTNFMFNGAKTLGIDVHSVWDVAWKKVIQPALEGLFKAYALRLINDLTEATVNWINSGFQGNPSFIDDPGKFYKNVANAAVGDFIFNDPDLNFLCSPFQIQVKLALGLSFNTFKNKINCTLSQVATNVQNAVQGASATVNLWDNWTQTTSNAQNTPIGAYLIAQGELSARLGDKQFAFNQQYDVGSGAISYEDCTETRTIVNGFTNEEKPDPGYSRSYQGSKIYDDITKKNAGHSNPVDPNFIGPGGDSYHYSSKCKVSTPGSVVTNMLGFKATSDQRNAEIQAALGTGINTIFQSLLKQLVIDPALRKLTKGALGTGKSSQVEYNLTVDSLARQAQAIYNSGMSNISASAQSVSNDTFSSYDDIFSGSISSSSGTTIPFSQGFNSISFMPGDFGTSDPLDTLRADAIAGIDYYLNAETTYQNALSQASTTLAAARAVFVAARNCNINYNTSDTLLRANLINSNIIQNIDGTVNVDSYRTLAQIPWNLVTIKNSLDISNIKDTILNTAMNGVAAASTTEAISSAMTPVNSTSFNTDPLKDIVANIDTWLRAVRDTYSTPQCPINLDQILTTTVTSPSGYIFNTNLSVGSTGPDVVALQQILIDGGYLVMPAGVSMGYFGTLTKNAVIQFQLANHIDAVVSATSLGAGRVGPYTRAFLNRNSITTTTTTTTTTTVTAPTGGITN